MSTDTLPKHPPQEAPRWTMDEVWVWKRQDKGNRESYQKNRGKNKKLRQGSAGRYLCILSQIPCMDQDVYETLVESAEAKGYPVQRLERIPQECSLHDSSSISGSSPGTSTVQ